MTVSCIESENLRYSELGIRVREFLTQTLVSITSKVIYKIEAFVEQTSKFIDRLEDNARLIRCLISYTGEVLRKRTLAIALVILLSLTACSGDVRSYNITQTPVGTYEQQTYYSAEHQLSINVSGDDINNLVAYSDCTQAENIIGLIRLDGLVVLINNNLNSNGINLTDEDVSIILSLAQLYKEVIEQGLDIEGIPARGEFNPGGRFLVFNFVSPEYAIGVVGQSGPLGLTTVLPPGMCSGIDVVSNGDLPNWALFPTGSISALNITPDNLRDSSLLSLLQNITVVEALNAITYPVEAVAAAMSVKLYPGSIEANPRYGGLASHFSENPWQEDNFPVLADPKYWGYVLYLHQVCGVHFSTLIELYHCGYMSLEDVLLELNVRGYQVPRPEDPFTEFWRAVDQDLFIGASLFRAN